MPLSPVKQMELMRALDDAAGDIVQRAAPLGPEDAGPVPVAPQPLPPARIADNNLNIVRHQDSGCIQFVFPVQGPLQAALPVAPLAPADADDNNWVVQAALRVRERMTQVAIEKIEAHNKTERLLSLRHGYGQSATAAELADARGRKVLLFIHGVFSSIEGAFGELDTSAAMSQLLDRYDGRVFGYDHWTIAKTPQQNALDLLRALPDDAGWDIDIVGHSRGGLVVRSLLATAPQGNAVLSTIAGRREGRIANVGKVFFVAAANQGSPLASPEQVQHFLNVAAMLASFSAGMALDVVIGLARMLVSLGFSRPSVQALASGSALIASLARSGTLLNDTDIYYTRADFDYDASALAQTGALLNRLMTGADSDLVVPYDSVLLPAAHTDTARMLSFGTPERKQHEVWHTEFFKRAEVHEFLLRHLGT